MGDILSVNSACIKPDIPSAKNKIHDIGTAYQSTNRHTGNKKE